MSQEVKDKVSAHESALENPEVIVEKFIEKVQVVEL